MHGKAQGQKSYARSNDFSETHSKRNLSYHQLQQRKMSKDFTNASAATCTSNQAFASREIEYLEIGSGEPPFSGWSLRKYAVASNACKYSGIWSACSSMCSAASTVASGVSSAEGPLSFSSSSDTTFGSGRNPANWSRGGQGQEHADARSHYCDADRGWWQCAETRSERKHRMAFEDVWPAKWAARAESFARRSCNLEPKLRGSFVDCADRQQPELEEYSLGSGIPYALGDR